MGDESLIGIVDLMTGEKDPRNLMLVFSILKVVMVEWDLAGHADVSPISNACADAELTVAGAFRGRVQLLSHHLQAPSKGSLRHHSSRLERSPARLYIF